MGPILIHHGVRKTVKDIRTLLSYLLASNCLDKILVINAVTECLPALACAVYHGVRFP